MIFLSSLLGWVEIVLCFIALCFLLARRRWKDYWALGLFLAIRAASTLCLWALTQMQSRQLDIHTAYKWYFYVYWISFAVEAILALIIAFGIYSDTIGPLRGLRVVGMVLVSLTGIFMFIAVVSAFAPRLSGNGYLTGAISQMQRTQSILTLCLVLFVCYAVRPLGLAFRSSVFGVSLGLGILALNDLLQSALLRNSTRSFTAWNLIDSCVTCLVIGI